jgi:hypothetical protein
MFFALCRTIFSPSILGEPFGRVFTLGPPVRRIGQCARVISGWPSDPLHVGRRVGRQFLFPSTSSLFDGFYWQNIRLCDAISWFSHSFALKHVTVSYCDPTSVCPHFTRNVEQVYSFVVGHTINQQTVRLTKRQS